MRSLLLAALTLIALPRPALAQSDDAPIPYDDTPTKSSTPTQSDETPGRKDEMPIEKADREVDLGRFDDPATGLGGETVAGLMLLESTRSGGSDSRFAFGLRFAWDIGRLFSEDFIHDSLFADLTWLHASTHDGTTTVFDDTGYNNFTIAPAWELPFGKGSAFGAYGQVGFGLSFWSSSLQGTADGVCSGTNACPGVSGLKPLLQYGLGVRGRPVIGGEDSRLRLTFRLELTRFRRAYLNDTFLGGSLGLAY
jgi:hypothetical protein